MKQHVSSVAEAYAELTAELSLAGGSYRTGAGSLVPLSEFHEIRNASITVKDPRQRLGPPGIFVPGQAVARFFWHLLGMSSLESIAPYCGNVDRFANDDGELLGSSYGRKIFRPEGNSPSQYSIASQQITKRPNTKRAYLSLCGRSELVDHPMDFACAIGLQMFPRDGVLHMTGFMRANNLTKLFCYNAFEFTMIHEWAAVQHDLELGEYTHVVGSLHSYEPVLLRATNVDPRIAMAKMPKVSDAELRTLATLEERVRFVAGQWPAVRAVIREFDQVHEYWRDLLMALLVLRLDRQKAKKPLREIAEAPPSGPVEKMQRECSLAHQAYA